MGSGPAQYSIVVYRTRTTRNTFEEGALYCTSRCRMKERYTTVQLQYPSGCAGECSVSWRWRRLWRKRRTHAASRRCAFSYAASTATAYSHRDSVQFQYTEATGKEATSAAGAKTTEKQRAYTGRSVCRTRRTEASCARDESHSPPPPPPPGRERSTRTPSPPANAIHQQIDMYGMERKRTKRNETKRTRRAFARDICRRAVRSITSANWRAGGR